MRETASRALRTVARLILATVFGGSVTLLTTHILQARGMPDVEFWHSDALPYEFDANDSDADFEGYLDYEDGLFDQLAALEQENARSGLAAVFDRFSPGSRSSPRGRARNWNRTYILRPETIRGGALLLHGLSDSPYSLRSIGQILVEEGYYVVGLRVPGHGTMPGALTEIDVSDWRETVALAAGHVAEVSRSAAGDSAPILVAGYSNGAALAVDHTLRVIEHGRGRIPDRLILLSPALTVSPLAALARVQLWMATIPGLEKLAWIDILPEYDPYKYNSFPVNAGRQIYRLTGKIRTRLERLSVEQRAQFPPLLSFGSVVDATVPPDSVVRLVENLGRNGSEVVLFDINRRTEAADFIRGGSLAYLGGLLADSDADYTFTLVTNTAPDSSDVVARSRAAGNAEWTERPLEQSWPASVYSLSHVAVPFPPDDPVYGAERDRSAVRPFPPIGSLDLRGERGVASIPLDLAMRLRHNPFFGYVEDRVREAAR
jgi:alpha-beta hydrolase superfamily lysophospholipase